MNDSTNTHQAVAGPAGPSPVRRARSIRRTSTIDVRFPDGWAEGIELLGNCRDAITIDADQPPLVVASASSDVAIDTTRTITAITVSPARHDVSSLVGARGGGHLRSQLDEVLPGERESGSPLYLILDDISGTSLIAGWALARLPEFEPPKDRAARPQMEGVCIGFAPGSSALTEFATPVGINRTRRVESVVHPDDPHGWHPLLDHAGTASMRRSRRIDVWLEQRDGRDVVVVDSAFQDSAYDPDGGRTAIHEYLLSATADATTHELLSVDPDPRILPFFECPSAVVNARTLVGTPMHQLRATVLERLARTDGCTHLNDALRALAEVPVLANHLDAALNA